jgi:hypothetical protein
VHLSEYTTLGQRIARFEVSVTVESRGGAMGLLARNGADAG